MEIIGNVHPLLPEAQVAAVFDMLRDGGVWCGRRVVVVEVVEVVWFTDDSGRFACPAEFILSGS